MADELVDHGAESSTEGESDPGTIDSAIQAELARQPKGESENEPVEGEPEPDDSPADDAPPEEEVPLTDFEFAGKKLQVPPDVAEALREGVMLKADHTRKTMEVAEQRKAVEARAQQVDQLYQLGEQFSQHRAALTGVDTQIEAIVKYLQTPEAEQDPMEYSKWGTKLQLLQTQRNALVGGLNYAASAKQQADEQRRQESINNTAKALTEQFSWTKERHTKVVEYAQNRGYRPEVLQALNDGIDPLIFLDLEKALQWDALQASKPAATKRAASAAPMKPGAATPAGNKVPLETMGKRLKSSGSISDAIALELARSERR